MPASQGYWTSQSVSNRTAANTTRKWSHMDICTYMHSSMLGISLTAEVLDSKFHLMSQINSKNSDNSTGSMEFGIEYSHETKKFEVVMYTVSLSEMSIKTGPVHLP